MFKFLLCLLNVIFLSDISIETGFHQRLTHCSNPHGHDSFFKPWNFSYTDCENIYDRTIGYNYRNQRFHEDIYLNPNTNIETRETH